MWLEEYHVDGLRYDSTLYIRTIDGNEANDLPQAWALMQQINGDIRARFPHSILIAEDLRSNPWITKAPEENGAGFHSQWDENFVHPVRAGRYSCPGRVPFDGGDSQCHLFQL